MDKFLINIIPREYQEEILKNCLEKNSLVILPTGIGKTLIALMLVIERMKKYPLEKVLILAPTRPLAQQHFSYFKDHLPELFAQIDIFTGEIAADNRRKIWERADIVFSTPQCIANDIKNNLYNLENVSLLIEDEAHRCVKNYAYTYVAKAYLSQATNKRILGLTASPGADKKTIKTICENLSIENVEIRTRESEDVKKYLQELEFEKIKVDFPPKFEEIRKLLKSILIKRIDELKNRNLLFGPPTKISLLEAQKRIMAQISSGNKNFNLLLGASTCAQAIKVEHAIELIETQTLYSLNSYIEGLLKQASENKSKAVVKLVSQPEFLIVLEKLKQLIEENVEHPKLEVLKIILKERISKNPKLKAIVFCQYRESINKICKELNSVDNITAKVFVGQAKISATSLGLSQKEQQEIIREFSASEFNVLCATSIGEEGLDIPEVNAVIFYEPVPSAIRTIQRAGRTARLMPGELIMLITKNTRDEGHFWAAQAKEKKMHKAIGDIKDDLQNNKINFNNEEKQKELF
ncbi:MAG: DEAD/DEAH box helicase [Nanoarchaeota archaeon]